MHFHTCPFFRQISPPYSQLAPRWTGNTAGGPLAFQPLTGSLKVLLITTQSLSPGLLRRAAGVSFSPHRQSMAIGPAMVAPLRAKCIALRRTRLTPLIRAPLSARPGAFPDVARVNRNVPAVLVYSCQATGERRFKGLSPYSQWQRGFLVAPKKFFQFFFPVFPKLHHSVPIPLVFKKSILQHICGVE